jgi:hypothetical protein
MLQCENESWVTQRILDFFFVETSPGPIAAQVLESNCREIRAQDPDTLRGLKQFFRFAAQQLKR